jgi:transketolase
MELTNPQQGRGLSSVNGLLDEKSLHLRRLVLRALAGADKGHVGSALSLIEIFRVLYENVVKHDPTKPTWENRDRVILSKGHGCLALYAVLADQGYFPATVLDTFCARHSPLGGHPERELHLGIEASTGALGHGLPIAVGMALGHRRRSDGVRVFVVVGDGELNEGSNWEALLMASKYQLSNLTVIVDHNADQLYGPLEKVLPLHSLRAKFEAFGALVTETDGHNPPALAQALTQISSRSSGPAGAVLCHTVKGKGLKAAERNPAWHYKRGLGEKGIREIAAEWAAPSETEKR